MLTRLNGIVLFVMKNIDQIFNIMSVTLKNYQDLTLEKKLLKQELKITDIGFWN